MTAAEWNERHPVGTQVRYAPVRGTGELRTTRTRSEAWTLASGHHVVAIEGQSGGVSLDHLTVP